MALSDYKTNPALNTSISGINIAENCPAGNLNGAIRQMMADLAGGALLFASGTIMLFGQTAAPTGWTKLVTHNNKALRVVSGSVVNGGTVPFTTAFAAAVAVSGTTGAHALSIDEMPAHFHGDGVVDTGAFVFAYGSQSPSSNVASQNISSNSGAGGVEGLTQTIGGGQTHSHSFTGAANLAVQYADVILAQKA